MFSDENKSSSLARFLNTFDYAMIDTCSLMDEAFPEWMDALANAKEYRKKGQEILVPRRCYDELKKHARQHKNDSRRIDAKRGLKILRRAKWKHLLTVTKKDKNENFADNAIYVKVCADRLFSKILIITQDKSLASDLRALNLLKSQSGKPIEVCKIVTGGRLVPNKGEENPYREHKGHNNVQNTKPQGGAPSPVEAVLSADARLSAVIGNPNYSEEKKKADALAQLKLLEKVNESTRAQLSLLVPPARLKEIAGLTKPKADPKPIEKKPEPKIETKATEKKPEPVKDRLWYGTGKTLAEAFRDCGNHYGLIFREPAVLYYPKAHGALDWTLDDLTAIESLGTSLLKGEEKISFLYRGVTLLAQKNPEKFKAWIDVNLLPKVLLPLSKSDKPKPSNQETKVEEPLVKKEPKPTKKEEPTPEPKKKAAEKKTEAAKEPSKAKAVKPKKESAAKTKEEKPSSKSKAAKAPSKKAEAPKETPKPEKAEVELKKPTKKGAPKKGAGEEKPQKEDAPSKLATALKAELRLRANLGNGNYPLESKIKDVESQIKRVSSLSKEDAAKVSIGVSELKARLEELKK